jgi:hypothetical protein
VPTNNRHDLVDLGYIDVGDIDAADVAGIARIARPEQLTRGKRKPADRWSEIGRRDGLDRRRRNKRNERRGIDRLRREFARHPPPSSVNPRPAPIMERRKAPGLIIDPVPTPRLDPDPMPLAIGRPIRGDGPRIPDLAVIRCRRPLAVGIQLLKAGHCRRHMV